jgi:hypothetical protein
MAPVTTSTFNPELVDPVLPDHALRPLVEFRRRQIARRVRRDHVVGHEIVGERWRWSERDQPQCKAGVSFHVDLLFPA